MLYRIIDVEGQSPEIAKGLEDILATAALLGLDTSFLGGSQRFIKVAARPEDSAAFEALHYYLETLPYDPAQAGDQEDDE
ncbi:hypothetical protein HFO09_23095 [Rhizobium laguerreae]|uniref:hypothetical protein n=1 Tax=Rhizobium laguerreae TaxID=1076926 RepID=UPI001C9049CA|nr:hypothetical protein [Rhizobium laguerreae]MBY3257043.1 hypothetical protein [Rhizobium laguerreae]MBY3282404.1 hypothetical protein [Rhizobium laguerreae]MBY3291931.1 hypothetical protein [Rhizobium laguerreae]